MPACLRLSVTAGGRGLELLEARLLLSDGPVITEFLAVNDSGLQDADLDYSDWIELHNPAAAAVDLSGWYLTDDAADLTKWAPPAGTSLAPHEYRVIFASDKDRRTEGSELHTSFRLSGDGEFLALVDVGHEVLARVVVRVDGVVARFDEALAVGLQRPAVGVGVVDGPA